VAVIVSMLVVELTTMHYAVLMFPSARGSSYEFKGSGKLGSNRGTVGTSIVELLGELSPEERKAKVMVIDCDLGGSTSMDKVRLLAFLHACMLPARYARFVCACVRACMRACICACVHACVYAKYSLCIHSCMYFCAVCVCVRVCACACEKMCVFACACTVCNSMWFTGIVDLPIPGSMLC